MGRIFPFALTVSAFGNFHVCAAVLYGTVPPTATLGSAIGVKAPQFKLSVHLWEKNKSNTRFFSTALLYDSSTRMWCLRGIVHFYDFYLYIYSLSL